MNKKPYSSAIKKTPYKYSISKKVSKLILNKLDRNGVINECVINNCIEVNSVDRRKEITNVIYERLLHLDDFLLNSFYYGDVSTSKFLLVYAIAKADSLFFDFMFEVYRESLLGNKDYISLDDFDNFFSSKKEIDSIVAKWSSTTINDLSQGYRNIIIESGLGKRVVKNIQVIKPMIHPEIEEHITLIGDKEYLQAMMGVK